MCRAVTEPAYPQCSALPCGVLRRAIFILSRHLIVVASEGEKRESHGEVVREHIGAGWY